MVRLISILFGAALLTGCNIPLRYQDTDHYKRRQQEKSERRMQEHLRVEAKYIERAKFVASEVDRIGAAKVLDSAKLQVANTLKDPESAKFRDVRFVMHEGGAMICGEVNGKNSYGGYVGFVTFLSDSRASEIFDAESGDERFTTKVRSKCTAPKHEAFQGAAK